MILIDADKINVEDVIGGKSEFANDIRAAMKDLIDEQSTAYDVDKILKELDEKKTESYYQSVDGDVFSMGENSAYQKAIEIVERGGIDETDRR
jgi:hypothetical protein